MEPGLLAALQTTTAVKDETRLHKVQLFQTD